MAFTICHQLIEKKQNLPRFTAQQFRKNNKWKKVSWEEYFSTCEQIAASLLAMGAKPGDKIAIFLETGPEWSYIDMASLGLGLTVVPIYSSSSIEDILFILQKSDVSFLFSEEAHLSHRLQHILKEVPQIKKVIFTSGGMKNSSTLNWKNFLQLGVDHLKNHPHFYSESIKNRSLDEVATIIYTSGTMGLPKGVLITHRQIMSEVNDTFSLFGITPKDCSLTFLPFAHVLARVEHWGHVSIGYKMVFADSIEKMRSYFHKVKPTFFIGVPRTFEKIYENIISALETQLVRKYLFDFASLLNQPLTQKTRVSESFNFFDFIRYRAADKLVFESIRKVFGGNLRFAISGGAPLNPEIAEFFHQAQILILEGYGLTETTAAVTVNRPFDFEFGTVGKPIGDVEVEIAEDGEILIKSEKVMAGYHDVSEETQDSIENSWLKTGDLGEWTQSGFLRITGRKKDMIKTAGGKYVAPRKLENLLTLEPLISHVHIHGDRRKYIVALITLDKERLLQWADENDISYANTETLSQHTQVQTLIKESLKKVNNQLSSHETIKNFMILPRDFDIDSGELTPSLKVKRHFCDKKYKEAIDRLYNL